MLSLPSLFLALIATLGYVSDLVRRRAPSTRSSSRSRTRSGRAFSQQVVRQRDRARRCNEVLHGGRADVISIGFVLALWAGSSATATFVNTITIAYDMRDLRGPVHSRLLALWLFLGTVVLGVFILPMLVLGPDLLRRAVPASVRPTVSTLISLGYYPVLVLAAAARADDVLPAGAAPPAAVAPRAPGRDARGAGLPGRLGRAAGLHQLHPRPQPRLRPAGRADRGAAVLLRARSRRPARRRAQRGDRAAQRRARRSAPGCWIRAAGSVSTRTTPTGDATVADPAGGQRLARCPRPGGARPPRQRSRPGRCGPRSAGRAARSAASVADAAVRLDAASQTGRPSARGTGSSGSRTVRSPPAPRRSRS